ncbi:uncharacterized protein LOC109719876 [Ananas comosus]|uniref:Uncharacterized protein LOC109719876 n=1 Tax=Ananas comosus TaxID=4615 RepID=A0A6P5G1Q3_ANACO|nr:uncharacterized protein LOC109719876 [Ananas comosus]
MFLKDKLHQGSSTFCLAQSDPEPFSYYNWITINIHASLTYILTAIGVNVVPTMDAIYLLFGTLLLLNCGFFVFLLHILYAVILTKLGLRASLKLPKWLDKAI